mmetsp:Transcript_2322/g.5432  ORF Transcript_2322/g.5432 Transcript_2322/m.5432 type:complete len:324 (-) Transcript_2322:759-1730(-)
MQLQLVLAGDVSTIEENFALVPHSHDQRAVCVCDTAMIRTYAHAPQQDLLLSRTVTIPDVNLFSQREEVTDGPGQDRVFVDVENVRLGLTALVLRVRSCSFSGSLLLRLLELLFPALGHLCQHLLVLCHLSRHLVFQLFLHHLFLFVGHDCARRPSTRAHLLLQSFVLLFELLDQHFGRIDVDLGFVLDLLRSISISERSHCLFIVDVGRRNSAHHDRLRVASECVLQDARELRIAVRDKNFLVRIVGPLSQCRDHVPQHGKREVDRSSLFQSVSRRTSALCSLGSGQIDKIHLSLLLGMFARTLRIQFQLRVCDGHNRVCPG